MGIRLLRPDSKALLESGGGLEWRHQPMNPKSNAPNRNGTSRAFTLTELLVVVTMLVLLSGLWVTANAKASRMTKRAQCAANLRQFAMVTQIYASESRDKLPVVSTGTWAWDVPTDVTTAMGNRGMTPKRFYCPGTAPRFNDNYNFLNPYPYSLWNFFQSPGYPFPSSRIIGYVAAFNGSVLALTNQNTTIVSERTRVTTATYLNVVPANSERVLLADATISENLGGTAANPAPAGSFVFVPGGFGVPHLSPHLKGTLPAGGNLAFKDGHVAWRKFSEMSQRATQGRGFWW
jgi:type II secretory pathway pseudopilin PulG